MERRQLEHFVVVAEELHFSRAAARLHIVQSGLSSSIRSLERELGTSLFVRSTHHVRLTEAGRALLPEAQSVLAGMRTAREAVGAVEGLRSGTLRIGIMQVLDPVDLPAILGRFHKKHPAVAIRLRQAGAAVLADQVRSGELDLAFVAMPTARLDGVRAIRLADQAMVVACPRSHWAVERGAVALRDLEAETFVEFPIEWGVRLAVDRAFAAAGVSRRVGFELNDVATLLDLVAHGLGVAIVPPSVVVSNRSVAMVRLRARAPRWQVSIVTPTRHLSSAAKAVVEMVPDLSVGAESQDNTAPPHDR